MLVFLHGSVASDGTPTPPPAVQYLIVSPAAHLRGQEVPAHWVDDKNNPIQFEILFQQGKAEVDDEMGNYLVKTGQAQKSRLILPGHWN